MNRILITGGAGFIGSHLVDHFVKEDFDVTVIDSLVSFYGKKPNYLNESAHYIFNDLNEVSSHEEIQDIDYIIHLAALGGVARSAREPEVILRSNVMGTASLLEQSKKWSSLKKILHISSFSVYGSEYPYYCDECQKRVLGDRVEKNLEKGIFDVICDCGKVAEPLPLTTEAQPNPLETYAASKYMQELCYRGYDHCPVVTFRMSSVYGDRLRLEDGEATVIAKLIGWIEKGVTPQLFEDGEQLRDWVYVADVIAAADQVIKGKNKTNLINICTGAPVSLKLACEKIAECLDSKTSYEVVGGFRKGDIRHCLGDSSGLKELLGREPISFDSGISFLQTEEVLV